MLSACCRGLGPCPQSWVAAHAVEHRGVHGPNRLIELVFLAAARDDEARQTLFEESDARQWIRRFQVQGRPIKQSTYYLKLAVTIRAPKNATAVHFPPLKIPLGLSLVW